MYEHDQIIRKIMNSSGLTNESKKNIKSYIFQEHKQKIIRQNAYNYDYSGIKIKNISESNRAAIEQYNFDNNVIPKLIKTVKNASEYGIGGILQRVGVNSTITQNVHIAQQPEYYNEVLLSAYLTVDYVDLTAYLERDLEVMKLWLNDEGKYVLSYTDVPYNQDHGRYILEAGKVQQVVQGDEIFEREYVYSNFDFCPLEILENNESAKSDWSYAQTTLELFAKFDAIIDKEWSYVKTILINNLLTGSDKSADEIQALLEKDDERVLDLADIDGMGGAPLSVLSQGGVTAEIARIIKQNYKEEVDELVFALGKLSGGNNKHTTEAIMSNLDAFKYLYIKKEFFTSFVAKLFHKIFMMNALINKDFEVGVKKLDVEIMFSKPIEMVLAEQEKPASKVVAPKAQ